MEFKFQWSSDTSSNIFKFPISYTQFCSGVAVHTWGSDDNDDWDQWGVKCSLTKIEFHTYMTFHNPLYCHLIGI